MYTNPSQNAALCRAPFALLCCAILFICSCAKQPAPPAQEPALPPKAKETPPPDFGEPVTAGDFISALDEALKFDAAAVFKPPSGDLAEKTIISLSKERPRIAAAKDVTAFKTDKDFIAIGFGNGNVHVYGGFACRHVILPDDGPVTGISGSAGSSYLAVLGKDGKKVTVFDLRYCGVVKTHDFKGSVTGLALSPTGNLAAAVDEARGLWFGPALGELKRAASLRFESRALAFTPKEGLLLAVDEAGWLMFWSPQTGKLVDSLRLPPGPYEEALFRGRYLFLKNGEGKASTYDVALRTPAKKNAPPEVFSLDNTVLSYRPERKQWVRRVLFGRPEMRVGISPGRGLLLVDDLDGARRCYTLTNGKPCSEAVDVLPDDAFAVDVGSDGRFSYNGKNYVLFDVLKRENGKALLGRSLPDGRFLLWWENGDDFAPAIESPHFTLPKRESISADSPVEFVPLLQEDENGSK